jgi:hypothetical protein
VVECINEHGVVVAIVVDVLQDLGLPDVAPVCHRQLHLEQSQQCMASFLILECYQSPAGHRQTSRTSLTDPVYYVFVNGAICWNIEFEDK